MINTGKLAGRTLFITGASRGIGKEIAVKCAKDGANVVIAAKTAEPHPKLPGTIYTAAEEVEKAGGKCLPVVMDIRDEQQVQNAVNAAVDKFGGIDILVNNASAISLTSTTDTPMKRYDLMHQCNVRGTFMTSKYCIPHLKKSGVGKILNMSPPLDMRPLWFQNHVAYTMSKFGMSMCVLGMAGELKGDNIAVNALWPKTTIFTSAMEMLMGGDKDEAAKGSRKPSILADAAYAIFLRPQTFTGNFCIDERVLKEEGITDMSQYDCVPGTPLKPDFFLPEDILKEFDPETLKVFQGQVSDTANAMKSSMGGASGGAGNLDGIFDKVGSLLNPDIVAKTGAVYFFQVKEGAEYYIDLTSGSGSVGKGSPSAKADVIFQMDAKSLIEMFTGSLKPTAAFMTGKMKIKGDVSKAMKLERLMGQMKSKL